MRKKKETRTNHSWKRATEEGKKNTKRKEQVLAHSRTKLKSNNFLVEKNGKNLYLLRNLQFENIMKT